MFGSMRLTDSALMRGLAPGRSRGRRDGRDDVSAVLGRFTE
jgi:hypothetical protein